MKYKIIALFSAIHFFAISQEYDFNNFIHLSISEGLSQSTVLAIEQDKLGQIWIGTRDGLNKYDGEEITVYRTIPNDTLSLSNNDILSIKEDKDGYIWIGTYNGLNRYNPSNQTFKRYFYSTENNPNQHFSIRTIKEIDDNQLWLGTSSGLFVYHKEKDEFLEITSGLNEDSDLYESTVMDIFKDRGNRIWIGTSSGLYEIEPKDYKIKKHSYTQNFDHVPIKIQALNEDDNGNLWIGTKQRGLLIFEKNTHTWTSLYKNTDQTNKPIVNKDIRKLKYDLKGNLWIGTYNGLFILEKNGNLLKITNQAGNPSSLSKNSIKEIFLDDNGSLWIGTYYGGVNLWDVHNNNFHTFYELKGGQAFGLGVVSAIAEDNNGRFYFGTEGQGIKVNYGNGKQDVLTTQVLGSRLKNSNIKSLLLKENKLWIGTLKSGIACFNLLSKTFEDSNLIKELNTVLDNSSVYAIARIDQQLVFGTFGNGIVVYDEQNQSFKHITYEGKSLTSLSNNRVRCMLVDSSKNLWIGTDKGINKITNTSLKSANPKVEHFLYEQDTYYGYNIISIYEDTLGHILVGTKERGILRFEDNNFQKLDLNLLNSEITSAFSIVEDDMANLWIGCNLGMVKYSKNTKKSIIYNQTEYFMGNEFINNSYLKATNENLYFGGIRGVSFFNPKQVKKYTNTPKIILTELNVNGTPIDQSISYLDKIVLKHTENSFSIHFALPNYIGGRNHNYAYRLIGLNNDWKFTNTHEVSYTIQKPGDYIFEVKEANNENTWYGEPTSIPIKVKATIWKTPIAYMLYLGMALFILYLIYNNLRAKIILAHKLRLERLESIRQEEINQSKLDFFTNISHDFRTPLTLILAPLQQLIENYRGTKEMFKKLVIIERNASQLLKLTNQLLDFRAFDAKHSKLNAEKGDIVKLLETIYQSFQEYADVGNYTYTFETAIANIQIFYDQSKLEKVFYNIISNAFKYTPKGGTIKIVINQKQDEIVIEISDNGKGINAAFIDKIFNPYYEVASDLHYQKHFNQGSGIGLHIAQQVVALHKGKITVDSKENVGTSFKVFLKNGTNHLDESEIVISKGENDLILSSPNKILTSEKAILPEFEGITSTKDEKNTILIVEDNHEFRKYMADILKEFYLVKQGVDGEDGFKKTLEYQPDLIVSDVIMPNVLGTELCYQIKNDARTCHIPVIMLTSRSSQIHKIEGLTSGADAYIEKPFHIKEFLLIIKNQLDAKERILQFNAIDLKNRKDTSISPDDKLFRKAINIVEEHMDNSTFDIAYFSSELGLSRTMLFVKVKAWTNLTPKEFILSIRMKKATQLLERNRYTVSEICYKVGFKNPKYFSKIFKKYHNQTPSEYAEKFYLEAKNGA